MSRSAAAEDRDHLVGLVEIDPLHRDRHAKHLRLKRQREVLLDHGEESTTLLRFVVGIDDRFFDEPLEVRLTQRPVAACTLGRGSGSSHGEPSKYEKGSSSYSTKGSARS